MYDYLLFRGLIILKLCFSLTVGLSQMHPLSKSDSGVVLDNLERYEYLNAQNDTRGAADALNQIAFTFWNNNHYHEAIKYYERSLKLNEKVANENGIAMINNNLGMLYSDIEDYQTSLDHFTKTLAARRANKEKVGMISGLINMSVVLNNLKRFDESIEHLQEAIDLSREMQDIHQMRSVYGMLSETYEKMGDVENSIKYFSLYRSFHEEVQKQEIKEIESELQQTQLEKQKAIAATAIKENEILKSQLELLKKDQIIEEKDSINSSLYSNLNRAGLENELLKRDAEIAKAEARSLEAEQRMYQWVLIVSISTALIIMLLISIVVIRTRRHNKVLSHKNELIKQRTREVQDANHELNQSNEQLKESLENLQRAKDKLVVSEKMASLTIFIGGIMHELNNSINYVAGSASGIGLIINDYKDQVKGIINQEDLELIDESILTIDQGVARVNKIFKDLRSDQSSYSEFRNFDMDEVVHTVKNELTPKADNKAVDIEVTLTDSPLEMDGDPQLIGQLLTNLIDNGIDACPSKNGKVEVSVVKNGEDVSIIVKDNGEGIPEEIINKIFDPFFTTKDVGEGAGLGLYMAYGYVARHKGSIRCESSSEGTSFLVSLPLKQQVEKPMAKLTFS
jgi:signal transduction histidine kinase